MGISIEQIESKSKKKGLKPASLKKGMQELFQPTRVEQPKSSKESLSSKGEKVTAKKKPRPPKAEKKLKNLADKKEAKQFVPEGYLVPPKDNYTKVPNRFLELLISGNLNPGEIKLLTLILRETIGWSRSHLTISKREWKVKTGQAEQLIYKNRKFLQENGLIEFGVDPVTGKNYYYIRSDAFDSEENAEDKNFEIIELLENHGLSKKKIESELSAYDDLIQDGWSNDKLMELINEVIDDGTLKGERVTLPVTYLKSGAIGSVEKRKNDQNVKPSRIYEYVAGNLNRDEMSEEELEWVGENGGVLSLNKLGEFQLKNKLGVSH